MNITDEQHEIINADFNNILVINAYAGTGKTSTLIKFCEQRRTSKILYMAYNSSMQKEASLKFAHLPNVTVKTMHSLAYKEFGQPYKDRLGNLRSMDVACMFDDEEDEKKVYSLSTSLLKAIRNFCNTKMDIDDFVLHCKTFENPNMQVIDKIKNFWHIIHNKNLFPYEHDFYLKQYQLSNPDLGYFDYILVDEAQDINSCVLNVVLRQKAKKVFIGDTYQSIYSFRGASNSLKKLEQLEDTKVLYLTQSFRCPTNIATIVNKYLMQILHAPKRFRGYDSDAPLNTSQIATIARTNAKLFDFAVENIESKLYFIGGIKSYNFQDLLDIQNIFWKKPERIKNSFFNKFSSAKELSKYISETKEIDLKVKFIIVAKYQTQNMFSLIKKIKEACVNNPEEADYILGTAHKSKGLEFDKVMLLDDFINIKKDINEKKHAKIDSGEICLLYVGMTRAKQTLLMHQDYVLQDNYINENYDKMLVS